MSWDYKSDTREDAIDSMELELYNLLTAHRVSLGLKPIPLSAGLTATAGRHALDTHYNVGAYRLGEPGEHPAHGYSDAKYDGRDSNTYDSMWKAGQRMGVYSGFVFEIAVGFGTAGSNYRLQHNAAGWFNSWLGSPPHRAVIENTGPWEKIEWNAVGVSIRGGVAYIHFGREVDPLGAPRIVSGSDDGFASELLLQRADGELLTWDSTKGADGFTCLANFGAEVTVRGLADVTGDGRVDMILQRASGEMLTWDTSKGAAGFADLPSMPDFQVAGTGRFVGSRAEDLLMFNAGTGMVRVVDVDGGAGRDLLNLTAGFRLVGSGNFNVQDGDEALFQNVTTGALFAFDFSTNAFFDLITLTDGWQG